MGVCRDMKNCSMYAGVQCTQVFNLTGSTVCGLWWQDPPELLSDIYRYISMDGDIPALQDRWYNRDRQRERHVMKLRAKGQINFPELICQQGAPLCLTNDKMPHTATSHLPAITAEPQPVGEHHRYQCTFSMDLVNSSLTGQLVLSPHPGATPMAEWSCNRNMTARYSADI